MEKVRMTQANSEALLQQLYSINRCYADTAFRMGHIVDVFPTSNAICIRSGRATAYIRGADTHLNSYVAGKIADDKYLTNTILHETDIPISPCMKIIRGTVSIDSFTPTPLQFPLVLKPCSGTLKGNGVITNIRSLRSLRRHMRTLFVQYQTLLIEEFAEGLFDYRVLVLQGRVIGVLKRIPPYIVGDGVHTIRQLIHQKNKQRSAMKIMRLGQIVIEAELKNKLADQSLHLLSVPTRGKRIALKNVCNFGAGGEVEDVTTSIHPDNAALAIRAAHVLKLSLAGLDFLCRDIRKPIRSTGGIIIEANQHPDIAMHYYQKPPIDVAALIIKALLKTA